MVYDLTEHRDDVLYLTRMPFCQHIEIYCNCDNAGCSVTSVVLQHVIMMVWFMVQNFGMSMLHKKEPRRKYFSSYVNANSSEMSVSRWINLWQARTCTKWVNIFPPLLVLITIYTHWLIPFVILILYIPKNYISVSIADSSIYVLEMISIGNGWLV